MTTPYREPDVAELRAELAQANRERDQLRDDVEDLRRVTAGPIGLGAITLVAFGVHCAITALLPSWYLDAEQLLGPWLYALVMCSSVAAPGALYVLWMSRVDDLQGRPASSRRGLPLRARSG